MRRPNFDNYKKNLRRLSIYRILYAIGCLILGASVLFILGLVGRCDYLDEVKIKDTWSMMTYLKFYLRCFASGGLGFILGSFCYYRYKFYEKWVKNFEKKWIVVEDYEEEECDRLENRRVCTSYIIRD